MTDPCNCAVYGTVGSWGVDCYREQTSYGWTVYHIRQILLQESNLVGQLSSELGLLDSATKMYLYKNGITGTIPQELGDMTSIASLSLSYNQLTGSNFSVWQGHWLVTLAACTTDSDCLAACRID